MVRPGFDFRVRKKAARRRNTLRCGPKPETMASRKAVLAEWARARRSAGQILDVLEYPTLARLLITAEHWARQRPRCRSFRFEGTPYRWLATNLGRVIVCDVSGQQIVGGHEGFLFDDRAPSCLVAICS